MIDKNQIDDLMNMASKNSGKNLNNEQNAAALNNILGKMSKNDIDKLKSVLSDKEATEKLLKSPQAQALFRQFGGKY